MASRKTDPPQSAPVSIRDRIVELRRVKGRDMIPHPKNWRTHPDHQSAALDRVLDDVGIANALLGYDTAEGVRTIDGHLRSDRHPDQDWPVLILDVDEQEADQLLASLDTIGQMAGTDADKLDQLVAGLPSLGEELDNHLEELREASREWNMTPGNVSDTQANNSPLTEAFVVRAPVDEITQVKAAVEKLLGDFGGAVIE